MGRLNKRQLYGILILGGILLLLSSVRPTKVQDATVDELQHMVYTEFLESTLEETLEDVEGVSNVKTMITLDSGVEYIPAYETEKGDATAGKQNVIVLKKKEGEEAFVLKERLPTIKGVLIVAEGVGNIETERNIIEAVKTVFDISAGRVKVLAK